MDIVSFLIGFLLSLLLVIIIFYYIYSNLVNRYTHYITAYEKESRALKNSLSSMEKELFRLKQKLDFSQEKILFFQKNQERMKEEFEHIAREVIEKKSENISQYQQDSLKLLLTPFAKNIKDFQSKVESFYINETKERFSLIKEIQTLKNLNEKISKDAINLTNALKGDNKLQGDWGEMILQKLLESSGLVRGREYEIQKSYKDSKGKISRPDVIIHLPDKKEVIIDSKVSLNAYERYHNCDEDEKEGFIKAHLDSIYMHIKKLSDKEYERLDGVKSLDFVLMFIPIEAAFMAAVNADKNLYEKAYQKNIIIVSPSTLLAVLRTIEHSWRYEYQNKNAKIIAKKAGDLYEKFNGFIESLQNIEKSLKKAQEAYDDAYKKLSSGKGNLLTRAKELKKMEGIEYKRGLK